jgi:hypothetical protein
MAREEYPYEQGRKFDRLLPFVASFMNSHSDEGAGNSHKHLIAFEVRFVTAASEIMNRITTGIMSEPSWCARSLP